MFDREKAIKEWKKTLQKNAALEDGDISELEGHLRDKIEDLMKEGCPEDEAFRRAAAEFEKAPGLDADYSRARSRLMSDLSSKKSPLWMPALAREYIRVALRHIKGKKIYSLINIFGLAAGLACCMIILLYVDNESNYDRYHQDVDRLFRVMEYRKVPAGEFCWARISAMVATVLKDNFSQVEEAARVFPVSNVLVQIDARRTFEDKVFYSEPDLFRVLTIPFVKGNPETALESTNGLVLTESLAENYFGESDPIGRRISIKDPAWARLNRAGQAFDCVVTGVVADPPSNTHFKYGMFLALSRFSDTWLLKEWHSGPAVTYVKLKTGVSPADFDKSIERMAYDYVSKELTAWGQTRRYFLQAVTDIHFRSDFEGIPIRDDFEAPGNRAYLMIYGLIALLVLVVGGMNFINLSNARGVYRIKEVGLRKVIGASRRQLVMQFLGESLLITVFAAVFSVGLVYLLLPLFNQFAGTTLSLSHLVHPTVLASVAALVFFVGILSGIYPAFVLTAFRPDQILRGTRMETRGSFALKVLVVGQFAISIFLATGAIVVSKQLKYMRGGELGFEMDYKYVVPFRRNAQVRKAVETMKTEFLRNPGVLGAAASSNVPGRALRTGYLKWSDDKLDKPLRLQFLSCDDDFIPEFKIEMAAGRAFDEKLNDENRAFLINEAAVPYLGYGSPEEALGDSLHESVYGRFKTIVGVISDFHFMGMGRNVEPLFMEVSSSRYDMMSLTLAANNLSDTVRFIEKTWFELFPDVPFDGFFLDEEFDRLYRKEAQVGKLLGILTAMGLTVACLGLVGLASFIVKHRTKEIGIRKVMGATVPNLMNLLSRRFVVLVILANVISAPLAYLALNRWLQDFPFRIDPGWDLFVMAGGAALVCAVLPILIHAFRAARTNPVDSLRYE